MARKARVELEGAVYRVLDCGDRREVIFSDDADRGPVPSHARRGVRATGWRMHAFVLMSNHYHLLLECWRSARSVCRPSLAHWKNE